MRLERGCDRPSESLLLPFAPQVRRCPRAIVGPLALRWVDLYNRFEAFGELPYPGPWADQPAVVGQAFLEIRGAIAEAQKELVQQWQTSNMGLSERPT